MSIRHTVFKMLDRPGGRAIVGRLSSAYLQFATRKNMTVTYDGEFWRHEINGWQFFFEKPLFRYDERASSAWAESPSAEMRLVQDLWYKTYHPRNGDVIVDIGAGRGEHVIRFSKDVGPEGRVIAVEANPRTFRMLRKFCQANHLDNVLPLQVAAADKPGTLYVVEDASGAWQADMVSADQTGIEVQSTTVDQIFEDFALGEIAFLKMNIEGAERMAVAGLENCAPRIRNVCICCHDFRADAGEGEFFRTRAFIEGYLERLGFQIQNLPYKDVYERDHVHAVRTST